MSQTLRIFIRESLYLDEAIATGRGPTVAQEWHHADISLGRLGAFRASQKPVFVIIAENPGLEKQVIVKHSQSEETDNSIERQLGAKRVEPGSSIVGELQRAELLDEPRIKWWGPVGYAPPPRMWYMLNSDYRNLNDDLSAVTPSSLKIGNGYFIVDSIFKMEEVQREYTPEFRKALERMTCPVGLMEAIDIMQTHDIREPEWVIGAGCFYDYANSFTASIIGSVGGALLGATAGLIFPILGAAGARAGAALGPVAVDICLRWPVIRWAHYNGKRSFMIANLIYVGVMILFGAWATWLSFLSAAKAPATAAVVDGVELITTTAGASSSSSIVSAFRSSLVAGVAEFIANFVAVMFISETVIIDTAEIQALLQDPSKIEQQLKDSRTALFKYIQEQYPTR